MVNERRFALGVQLIDRASRSARSRQGLCAGRRRALVALGEATVAEFAAGARPLPGWRARVLGLGRLGGRALTHASDLDLIYLHTRPQDGDVGRPQAARPQRLLQPPGEPRYRGLERPDRCRAALRGRHPAPSRGRQGHAGGLARRVRAIPAQGGLDVGAYGLVPRPAGVRLARRSGARRPRSIDATSCACRAIRRRCATMRR